MEQTLTVDDLVSDASLAQTVLAGSSGLGRRVLWAHSTEMADPLRWLGPSELYMTIGMSMPTTEADQIAFITRLDEGGLAGMTIGDHDVCPRLHPGALRAADTAGFPILLTGPEASFAAISRTVAAANTMNQTMQVLALSKLYHVAAQAPSSSTSLIDTLGEIVGAGLHVVDTTTGCRVLGTDRMTEHAVQRRYPLQGSHAAHLVVTEQRGNPQTDTFILTHLLTVVQVETDRVLARAHRRAERSRMLAANFLRSPGSESYTALSQHVGGVGTSFSVVVADASSGPSFELLCALRGISAAATPAQGAEMVIMPTSETAQVKNLLTELGASAGCSTVFTDPRDCASAAAEARTAYAAIRGDHAQWRVHSDIAVTLLARSRREAQSIAAEVLRDLAEHTPRMSLLRETLHCFLQHDRKWQPTADALGIHRQSLAYRLSRIEALTGRTLQSTADLSALWVACDAWNRLNPPQPLDALA